ncbi:MAG: hypothetical protein R1F52_00710 [Candidatus Nitrosoabyssus spongiisocia]|nr:MAG: hypothetical protein R1F52_00710 [Nitrosopumilaceae archaeon AB1(1)]
MQVQEIASKVLKTGKGVRVVTVCDMNGKIVYSARPKSIKILLGADDSKTSLRNAARQWRARKALARKIGQCRYVLAHYEKVKRITMPAGKNHLLFITTSNSFDHMKIVRKVRRL